MKIKKLLLRFYLVAFALYLLVCTLVYFFQERLLFHPEKLPDDFKFQSENKLEEVNINSRSGNKLNTLFFKCDSARGVIIYFHGNAGSLRTWVTVADRFLQNHFDIIVMDYPGYGKSTGKLSEANLFTDAQSVYDILKKSYSESNIIVYGRSIGTGFAAQLGSVNHPGKVILESPYFSMEELAHQLYPLLPVFILRFPLRTNEYIKQIKCRVILFHGTDDEVIPYQSSLKLKALLKPGDELCTVNGGHHNDLNNFSDYSDKLKIILTHSK